MFNSKAFAFLAITLFSGIASARVCVYQDKDFGGASYCWDARDGGSPNLANLGFNDMVSSIEITRGEEVEVCTDAGYRGACARVNGNVYNLDRAWNDQISSITIRDGYQRPPQQPYPPQRPPQQPYPPQRPPQRPPQGPSEACFFTDAGYAGTSFCLSPNGRPVSNLGSTGYNDKISSIQIPRGLIVTVYQDANFAGDRRTYTGNVLNLKGDFNDIISSIVVERR